MYERGIMHLECGYMSYEMSVKFLRQMTVRLTKLDDSEFELWYENGV